MSEYNAKNYTEQGGEVTHIGGKIILEEGGEAIGFGGGGSGTPGADGFSPIANVKNNGDGTHTITITDKRGTTSTTVSNGANGANGTDGQDGVTPSFSIGTVTQDSVAGATITGTSENPVLNLKLPKGDTGATKTFQIGTVTQGDTPAVEIASDVNNVVTLNFVLP